MNNIIQNIYNSKQIILTRFNTKKEDEENIPVWIKKNYKYSNGLLKVNENE